MSTPKAINPVKSKIPFVVDTANHIIQAGKKAELSMDIAAGQFPEGATLTLNFLGIDWTFTFTALPDSSGYQLPANLIGVDYDIYMAILVQAINKNQLFFPYYTAAVVNTNYICFTAKEIGEVYSIYIVSSSVSTFTDITNITGLDEILRVNFGIHAQTIALTLDDQEILLGEDRIAGNYVEFQVQDYLALLVESLLYFPQSSTSWKKTSTDAVKNFFIRYWERAADYFSTITDTATYKAIGGGLTKLHEQLILEDAVAYLDLMKSGDFLMQTNRPLLSNIHYDQPVLFYFVNHFPVTTIFRANLLIKYTDSTTHNAILNDGNSLSLAADQQGCFLISPAIHGLADIDPTKTIAQIDFYISLNELSEITAYIARVEADGGTVENIDAVRDELISLGAIETKSETFQMIVKDSLFAKGLIFRNSFDTFDSATFFGISQITDKYSRLFFEALSTKIQTQVSEQETLIINSGWMYLEERNALRDLIRSPEIYMVYGNNLFRVNILTNKTIRHLDKEYLFSLKLEVELTGDNKYYSARTADSLAPGILIADDNFIISDGENIIGY
jgi:hypothetical protein